MSLDEAYLGLAIRQLAGWAGGAIVRRVDGDPTLLGEASTHRG